MTTWAGTATMERPTVPVKPQRHPDTYDLWARGRPIATGIQTYSDAQGWARYYSGQLPDAIVYMFYSGVYCTKSRIRPLAVFRLGKQLPFPIRVTASDDLLPIGPESPPLSYVLRRPLRVRIAAPA